jgi:hypothetical protein
MTRRAPHQDHADPPAATTAATAPADPAKKDQKKGLLRRILGVFK